MPHHSPSCQANDAACRAKRKVARAAEPHSTAVSRTVLCGRRQSIFGELSEKTGRPNSFGACWILKIRTKGGSGWRQSGQLSETDGPSRLGVLRCGETETSL